MTDANRRAHEKVVARLARLHAIATSYTDASGAYKQASTQAIAAVLAGLGSPAATLQEARLSEAARIEAIHARAIEPVTVVWAGKPTHIDVAPGSLPRGTCRFTITLESGDTVRGTINSRSLKPISRRSFEGVEREFVRITLPVKLEPGYHTLSIEAGSATLETLLIAAPRRSFRHPASRVAGAWGVFSPMYALRSERNMGIGDFTDLESLFRWSAGHGGKVLATLPMLAAFLGEKPGPFDPSPYNPVSRLFWNEVFIDPTRLPEYAASPDARRMVSSAGFKKEAALLRALPNVDYRRVASLKRRVLESLAEHFFAAGGERSAAFGAFEKANPLVREYAAFRAATEKQGKDWGAWPAPMRTRRLTSKDADPRTVNYHVYVQYAADTQLADLSRCVRERGGLVYLDLPVGVSPFGFDVYRAPQLFAQGCSTGAPPDPYFTGGQDWGFPPLHPDAIRTDRYRYFIDCVRNHMRHSDYLRLDHVMAFHRLFFIPTGMGAAHGLYVHYRAEEFYAILCLESHRNVCRLVGENLGTVPPAVNKALAAHDLCGLYVGQYEMQPSQPSLRAVPANAVACANTHDMPTIATTWSAKDVDDRIALGLLAKDRRQSEKAARQATKIALIAFLRNQGRLSDKKADPASVRDALHEFLASGSADFALINLEDMWLESRWQNVPGTMHEHDNWQHKFKHTLEEIVKNGALERSLARINDARPDPERAKPAKPSLRTKSGRTSTSRKRAAAPRHRAAH